MKTVDHSYEQALIMHDNLHIHVIMNIIVTPNTKGEMAKGNTLELFFLHSFHNNSKFHFLLLHCSALPKYTLTFIMLDLCQFDCVQKQ